MFTDTVADYKLQRMLQYHLAQSPHNRNKFKSILHCGTAVLKQPAATPAVFVVANEKQSSFFGMQSCKNPWICPVCEARTMSKYATRIACAIEALKRKPYNQKAIMITLTVPHSGSMSCETTMNILNQSWKDFIIRGNKQLKFGKRHQKTINGKKTYTYDKDKTKRTNDAFAAFCEEFNCRHRVRVGEFTWGEEHGWHPHFHCLFWVDADKIDRVLEFEQRLFDRWLSLVKKNTLKEFDKLYPDNGENNHTRVEIMFKRLSTTSKALFISKKDDGKEMTPIVQESSMYVCGWGADKEITGNYQRKATNEGHYTPHQLLQMAYDGEKYYLEVFMEFANAIKSRKRITRVNFSVHSGINKIVAEFMKTDDYLIVVKKKVIELRNQGGKRKVLGWFNEQQWLHITILETFEGKEVKAKILQAALKENPFQEINRFLEQYDIKLNPPETHELSQLIESQIYGNSLLSA